jgi:non-reducing end alpha-L-arabinofuranosidase
MNRPLLLSAPLLVALACQPTDTSTPDHGEEQGGSDAAVPKTGPYGDGGRDSGGGSSGGNSSGGNGGTSSGGASSSGGGGSGGSGAGPCDIYAAGNTPCVAAYSTTRALFSAYSGNLYQVRKSDGSTKDVGVLSPGGIADSSVQDGFCPGKGSCTISIIYDQSGKGNHLTKAPGGSAVYGPNDDVEAVADALPITLGGKKVYGVHVVGSPSWTSPGQVGYRNTKTNGIAKGDDPETEYMLTDGTYYNGSCCFDFGNAEMQATAGGYGTMEAIYFGSCNWWDTGEGAGPWVMADLEVGVYNHGGKPTRDNSTRKNGQDRSFSHAFVTAMLKGNSANATNGGPFTLKGGNAQTGMLETIWDGKYPDGYSPMHRQGGVVLGVGGDNSSMAQGNFYEGVMTTGYASTATDDAVHANIVAAGYEK